MKTAAYYSVLADKKVRCDLCPHHCLLTEGKRGICLTRQNRNGALISLNYCRPVSTAIDPIEKKPLYHFYPGTRIFSTGPNGCTLKCGFCQNCEISQEILATRETTADKLAAAVIESGTIGIAYTYSEPCIWFETIMDIGTKVKEAGLKNVMVTNGFIEPPPLKELLGLVNAMNIDIKSMNPRFYRRICKGELAPVLRTCEIVKKSAHLEITNLLIPAENDSAEDIRALSRFIAANLGPDTPLHISRYFPRYKFRRPSTPEASLLRAWEIAREYLEFVYLGNMAAGERENTSCPSCAALLIRRSGYHIETTGTLERRKDGTCICGGCGRELNIVW